MRLETLRKEESQNDTAKDIRDDNIEEDEESKIPTIELDGNIYIGIISIPKIGIELPVLKNWSYYNLNFSPCRYKGTVSDNNMILAAHNYRSHFGRIGELNSGDEIQFIDINGIVYSYEVVSTEYVGGTNVEAMNFGASDDWNLTLFTCTLDGQTRVTVRALRTEY